MVLKIKGARPYYFDRSKDSVDEFGITEEHLKLFDEQGAVPVKYEPFTTEFVIDESQIEGAYVDYDGDIKLFTKSGGEFLIENENNVFEKIKNIIEFNKTLGIEPIG